MDQKPGTNLRLDWQWPPALLFAVVFITLGVLVALGKLHVEVLLAALTWLAPGPYQTKIGAKTLPPPEAQDSN